MEELKRPALKDTTYLHVLTLTTVLLTQMAITVQLILLVTGMTLLLLSVMEVMMVRKDSQHKQCAVLVVVDVSLKALDTIVKLKQNPSSDGMQPNQSGQIFQSIRGPNLPLTG